MKVTIGKSTKKYTHKFKFKNYTTSSFGAVQPLFHQFMNNGDKLSLSSGQLVRLAPMPVPTLGDLKVINKFRFVEMNELYPYYDAFLAKRSVRSAVKTFIPTKLPFVTNNSLWSLIFYGDRYLNTENTPTLGAVTCYKQWSNHPATTYIMPTADAMSQGFSTCLNALAGGGNIHPDTQSDGKHYLFDINSALTQSNCDFCFIDYASTQSASEPVNPNIFCIKLNNAGRRIFNVLRGLGFSLDPTDTTELDLLPIFAFVKAYFDEYQPQRSINWHSTDAYNFLIKSSQSNIIDFSVYNNDPDQTDAELISLDVLLHSVLYELRNCFYTYENDWVSVHTSKALNDTPSESISVVNGFGDLTNSMISSSSVSHLNSVVSSNITQYTLDALRMLTRRQAKESLIGGKIYEYIKNKYGSGVADDMFSESHNIGSFISNCSVQDVLSSADTASGSSGERLGAYAGLGIGSGKNKLRFRAPNFGFFIALMSVVPESRYYQGNDPTLTALTREECPNADYDALGYELTPRSSIYDNNGYAITPSESEMLTRGFGFVPRLSKWKYKKDIVNGCMRHRSVAASFNPYHLDRIVSRYKISGNFDIAQLGTFVPDASIAWRYVGKYAQLGNFNRIFYNSQEATALSIVDDNFIIDTAFTLSLTNCLKPMSESYQAKDEEIDNSVSSVSAE